jgi:hypothetical protein
MIIEIPIQDFEKYNRIVAFLRQLDMPFFERKSQEEVASEAQNGRVKSLNGADYPESSFDIESLGVMDNTPFDLDYIRENHTIQWEYLHEIRESFKDAPFDEMLACLD